MVDATEAVVLVRHCTFKCRIASAESDQATKFEAKHAFGVKISPSGLAVEARAEVKDMVRHTVQLRKCMRTAQDGHFETLCSIVLSLYQSGPSYASLTIAYHIE